MGLLPESFAAGASEHLAHSAHAAKKLNRLVVDVFADYDADPTGIADSTSAIQAAIDYVAANGGGTVYFPAGTYKLTATLTWTANGVILRGAGKRQSILKQTGATNGVKLNGSGSSIRYCLIEHLRIQGSGATGSGLVIHHGVENEFRNLQIDGFTSTNKYGIEFAGTATSNFYNTFIDVTASGNYRGAVVYGQLEKFIGCRFQGNTSYGIEDYGYAPSYIACGIEGNGAEGLVTSQNYSKNILACYFEGNATAQIYSLTTNGLKVEGCYFSPGAANCPTGILLGRTSGSVPNGVSITGNAFSGTYSTAGIYISGVQDAFIMGNYTPQIVYHGSVQLLGDYLIQGQGTAYTPTNVTTDRSFDADTVVVAELADVVGTLIADLQAKGVLQ